MVQDLKLTTQELSANRAMFGHAASTLAKLDRAADDIERTAASARGIIDGDGRNAVAEVSGAARSEEHTSELQSLMRNSYAVFCLKQKKSITTRHHVE